MQTASFYGPKNVRTAVASLISLVSANAYAERGPDGIRVMTRIMASSLPRSPCIS